MTRLDGIDISHHQDDAGPIDWAAVKSTGVFWVATKATQGLGYTDPTFTAHRMQMAIQGFRHRVFYHWLTPGVTPAGQAAHFLNVVGNLAPGEGAMLDAEEAGITAANVLAWCRAVEDSTHRPCSVYSGAYVAGGTIWQSTEIRHSLYGPRPMHLAAYTSEERALKLPGVKAYPWAAWQYSSNGPVAGIVGRCDMNRVDDREIYDVACAVPADRPHPDIPDPAPTPPPQGDDMALKLTNRLPGKYGARNESWWLLLDSGEKRHIPTLEELGARASQPTQECDDAVLDGIPDWQPATGGSVDREARDSAAAANAAVARVGQDLGDTKTQLRRAGEQN